MSFSFYESLVPASSRLAAGKASRAPAVAIGLCQRDFSSMVGLIFDVSAG
jgi:hypothetical protein